MRTLSSAEYKRHDAITFVLFIAMMLLIAVVALTHQSCTTGKQYVQDMSYMNDTVKWNQFLECSKDQGDLGCDSCFFKIYGYYLDDAYETYR